MYDYGFLDMAKSYLHRNLEALAAHLDAGTPMVVLEPSCCSVFRDEMHNLLPDSAAARRLAENTFTLSEFLEKRVPGYTKTSISLTSLRRQGGLYSRLTWTAISPTRPKPSDANSTASYTGVGGAYPSAVPSCLTITAPNTVTRIRGIEA